MVNRKPHRNTRTLHTQRQSNQPQTQHQTKLQPPT
jgi:hypothetical protein